MSRVRRDGLALGLVVACGAASAAGAAAQGWQGAGWYHVVERPSGMTIEAGPYATELACKKAMNASGEGRACRELTTGPNVRKGRLPAR